MDPQYFCCTTLRDVIFMEGDFREYYINDLYTTYTVVCWVTTMTLEQFAAVSKAPVGCRSRILVV
jgi:hypothetical protein